MIGKWQIHVPSVHFLTLTRFLCLSQRGSNQFGPVPLGALTGRVHAVVYPWRRVGKVDQAGPGTHLQGPPTREKLFLKYDAYKR